MLDIGWPEMLVILAVALIVIGPKDLPKALYTVGKWVRAARKMTGDFQRHVDEMVRDTELEEVKKAAQSLSKTNLKREIAKTIDPKGELDAALSVPKELTDLGRLDDAAPATRKVSAKAEAEAGPETAALARPAPAAPAPPAEAPAAGGAVAADPPAARAGGDKSA